LLVYHEWIFLNSTPEEVKKKKIIHSYARRFVTKLNGKPGKLRERTAYVRFTYDFVKRLANFQ